MKHVKEFLAEHMNMNKARKAKSKFFSYVVFLNAVKFISVFASGVFFT